MAVTEEELAELMRKALNGDEMAYRRFLGAVAPRLRENARRQLSRGNFVQADCEDIVQETLLAIHTKRQTWDQTRPISPWLSAIARHKFIDHLRRKGGGIHVPIEDVAETLPSGESLPEANGRDIDIMLGRLNSRQQSVVRSVSIEGTSVKETAQRLGMSEGAVRVTLHRSLRMLSTLFRETSR